MSDTQLADDRSVPVEHRLAGLDARLIAPTAMVAVVVLLWSVILPWVAGHFSYDIEVEPGQSLDIGSGVSVTPPRGWEIEVASEGQAIVHHQGVTVRIEVGSFDGDELGDLLSAVNEVEDIAGIAGPQSSVTTQSGLTGLVETFQGPTTQGVLAVFSESGIGIEFAASGPPTQVVSLDAEIDEMLSTVAFDGGTP